MEGMAVWIALGAVFVALIPTIVRASANARRKEADRRKGDDGSVTASSSGSSYSDSDRKSPDSDSDGGWGLDGGGGDGGGGGGD